MIVDLRSDTVTRPSSAMRDAMFRAEVGDDVFEDDPTVNELERLAAHLTGHEAAIFVPSGCMANLIAQMIHVRRGDQVIVGALSHIVLHEVGSGAAIANAQYDIVPGDGRITAADVEERIHAGDFHEPGTGLVWVENTHNMAGGRVVPPEVLRRIASVCRAHRVPLHLDGARVFNAAVALGIPVRELTQHATSVSFCLSKGLGTPIGSLLVGTAAFRAEARRFRKMLGGGMRQVGVVAAAGIYALTHNVDRLAEDHARARRLAEGLAGLKGLAVRPDEVETNIVIATLDAPRADGFVAACAERGVHILALDKKKVRFVTHLDVDDAGIDHTLAVVRGVAG